MVMMDKIIEETKESIRNFKGDPVNNLGFLIPVVIGLIALGSGIVTYIMYIFGGGYTVQINAAKEYGWFGGYSEKFTTGTTGMISSGVIGKIILLLVGIEFILMMINYFQCNGKGKRILMIMDLFFLAIQSLLIMNIFVGSIGIIVITLISKLFGVKTISPQTFAYAWVFILIAAIITFIVLVMTTKECRWMLGYTALALVIAKVLIPVVFLVLQNIVSIFMMLIVLLVIAVGIILFLSGGNGDGAETSNNVSGKSYGVSSESKKSNIRKLQEKEEKERKMKQNKNSRYISNLNEIGGNKLFKVHGAFGDYIQLDNGPVNKKICSLEALEKGKFHIYDEKIGREIKSDEIPWKK